MAAGADLLGVTVPRHLESPMSPMALLEQGIPLSLLMDLVCGPMSADLIAHEHDEQGPGAA